MAEPRQVRERPLKRYRVRCWFSDEQCAQLEQIRQPGAYGREKSLERMMVYMRAHLGKMRLDVRPFRRREHRQGGRDLDLYFMRGFLSGVTQLGDDGYRETERVIVALLLRCLAAEERKARLAMKAAGLSVDAAPVVGSKP